MGNGIEMTSSQNAISVTLLEATSVLAENLSKSVPFLRFQEADRKLKADQKAKQLLMEFSDLQQLIRSQQYSGIFSETDMKQLHDLQKEISNNKVIQEQAMAQEVAITFLREVNQEISSLIGTDFASLARHAGCCG